MTAFIVASGIQQMTQYLEQFPAAMLDAATMAINEVAGGSGLTALRKDMRAQVNFPSGYLESDRLKMRRRASSGNLEAVISGRDRATSLARFAAGQTPANTRGRGVRVGIKPGRSKNLGKRAFLLTLKNGNRGLAIRLKPGERLKSSGSAIELEQNVYLLYGPSVDQVFRGVAEDNSPLIAEMVTRRFLHHFARAISRG